MCLLTVCLELILSDVTEWVSFLFGGGLVVSLLFLNAFRIRFAGGEEMGQEYTKL